MEAINFQSGELLGIMIEQMAFFESRGVVIGRVVFKLSPKEWETEGSEIAVSTAIPWKRDHKFLHEARLALATNAHRLLNGAGALPEQQIQDFLQAEDPSDMSRPTHIGTGQQ
ncbi:hypothetical protein PARPLA_03290 [Rhodobacteraceae bacterium THAF1]|uniref:hypothetical protein n=1 Tax=Palleronia sp. THAF1 TaxID=2587842 RepID=UPI000F3F8B23|nr:hypothetical protein [Palleronia sp. THAF1]QFU10373.1 hypothetical protein FIU81_16950 [Palleronia sp. THAF1]VDC31399.1 hypothetical protein PARPLA_03290 [Rhodobacteraceae bacterium THAF1]